MRGRGTRNRKQQTCLASSVFSYNLHPRYPTNNQLYSPTWSAGSSSSTSPPRRSRCSSPSTPTPRATTRGSRSGPGRATPGAGPAGSSSRSRTTTTRTGRACTCTRTTPSRSTASIASRSPRSVALGVVCSSCSLVAEMGLRGCRDGVGRW